jgi:hypothetical protein
MPEQNDRGRKVQESLEIVGVELVASNEAPEVEEPREETLDLPASAVAAKLSTVLGRHLPIGFVRCDELEAALLHQTPVEPVAVIGLVANEALRLLVDEHLVESLLDQGHFVGASAFNPKGERKASAVCDCHDLGPLAFLGFSDAGPPFLAPEKEPSMNDSLRSRPPRSRRSRAIALNNLSMVPSWTHC